MNLDQPKTMSTERLLEDVVLMLEYHKLDTLFMAYVPTVFQKGNTGPLMVSAYQALKKRRYFRRFAGLGYISESKGRLAHCYVMHILALIGYNHILFKI